LVAGLLKHDWMNAVLRFGRAQPRRRTSPLYGVRRFNQRDIARAREDAA